MLQDINILEDFAAAITFTLKMEAGQSQLEYYIDFD
jgi:hypothetical protein